MSASFPVLKKPKLEVTEYHHRHGDGEEVTGAGYGGNREQETGGGSGSGSDDEATARKEQEEALVALIEHREKEVEHLRNRIKYYNSQLEGAEKKLEETKNQLARHRGRDSSTTSKADPRRGMEMEKVEERSIIPVKNSQERKQSKSQLQTEVVKTSKTGEEPECDSLSPSTYQQSPNVQSQSRPKLLIPAINAQVSQRMNGMEVARVEEIFPAKNRQGILQSKSQLGPEAVKTSKIVERPERGSASPTPNLQQSPNVQSQSRPKLLIPAINPQVSQPKKTKESGFKASSITASQSNKSSPANGVKTKEERSSRASPERKVDKQPTRAKRKIELKEHQSLIPDVRRRSSPIEIRCQTACLMNSHHKRKLRSLITCPANDQLFSTSALDGFINLWEIKSSGSSASLLKSTDCFSSKERRWPEDIAWHPQGDTIFSVYSADGGDSQISVLDLNKTKEGTRVRFLEEKPHVKGIINSIEFMPWEDTCFVTGGSDHSVFFWTEGNEENSWKYKTLHRSFHTSAVMGVAGMHQKKIVLSVGVDKKIHGFDVNAMRSDYQHQLDSKCLSVLPNPCDFNLFMVQSGTPGKQLRLFDIRARRTEVHAFGWKQESSDTQSALINQAWSPDGLYITSGSADPMIHIFDIRYDSHRPSQSISAHQKRVFKAVWHKSLPLLISISSDLNIGMHKIKH